VVDDLPQGRCTRAARAVNRGHKGCSSEHSSGRTQGRKKYPSQSDAHRSRRISRFIHGCTLHRRAQ
jgi:hypothetical protein